MPKKKSRPQKRRRRSIIAFEMIRLDRTAKEPLHEQLYRQIRDELKSGRFSDSSSRLPSFMPKGISAQSPAPEHLSQTFCRKHF